MKTVELFQNRRRTMYFTKVLSLAFLFVCLGSSTFGQQCVHIGGGVITNIGVITPNRTLGTAIGDLKGAIGVEILTNLRGPWNDCLLGHDFWVTEVGDTIFVEPAQLAAFPDG